MTSTTSVHVNGPKSCAALFEPLVSSSPRTVLSLGQSDWRPHRRRRQGSVLAREQPLDRDVVSEGNRIDAAITDARTIGAQLRRARGTAARRWRLRRGATPSVTTFNGLEVSGSGRGCNALTGRFIVREIVFGSGGTVQRFAVDFEQHCNDVVPALFGAIRYNSTVSDIVPFNGVYPSYDLSLTTPGHGRISGPGIDCGGAGTQCQLSLAMAAQLNLTAVPDPGYTFMGWIDDCSGGAATTLHVNGPKRCAASFEPSVSTAPRTLLRWDSEPGHTIGQGRSEVLSLANSRWTASPRPNGNGIDITVQSVGPTAASSWSLNFQPPTGELLEVGRRYLGADRFPAPGIPAVVIFGNGRFCGGGEFTVRELLYEDEDTLLRFAADFVLNCGSASGPLLTGSVKYNSRLDMPPTTLSVDPECCASPRCTTAHPSRCSRRRSPFA